MIKLEGGIEAFKLNGIPYQRGQYRVRVVNNAVSLQEIGSDVVIANLTLFSDWTNGADVPYPTLLALRTDLRTFIFM